MMVRRRKPLWVLWLMFALISFMGVLGSVVAARAAREVIFPRVLLHPALEGTWQTMSLNTTATLHDISWYRPGLGYVVGSNGTLILVDKQTPGDVYVEPISLGTSATLYGVSIVKQEWGCAVGSGGTVFCLTGKKSWVARNAGTTATLYDVDLVWGKVNGTPHAVGWAVGEQGVIRRTLDEGASWTVQDQSGYVFYSVHASSVTEAWAGGYRTTDGTPVVLHTTDGGTTWTVSYVGTTTAAVRGVYARGDDVWAVGTGGLILHSADRGATWTHVPAGTMATLMAVWQGDGPTVGSVDDVWIAGSDGIILHSTDGGATFALDATGVTLDLLNLSFYNAYHGAAAVGVGGTFLWYAVPNRTWTAYHASTPPTVDGDVSEWMGMEGIRLNGYTANFVERSDEFTQIFQDTSDMDMTLWAAWDEDYLYIALRVVDDAVVEEPGSQPWHDDELELAIDGDPRYDCCLDWPNGPDHQYTLNPSGRMTDWASPAAVITSIITATTQNQDGWAAEVAIPREELNNGSHTVGKTVGVTVGYHDDDNGSGYDMYFVWEGYLARPAARFTPPPLADWLREFGTLILSATPVPWATPPTPTATPTPSVTPTPTPTSTPVTSTIEGHVFQDLDRDRVRDDNEPGLAGARVQVLYAASVLIGEQVTGEDGAFLFTNLNPGLYLVRVVALPPGYEMTTPAQESRVLGAGTTMTVLFGAAPVPTPTPTATFTPTPTPVPWRHLYFPYLVRRMRAKEMLARRDHHRMAAGWARVVADDTCVNDAFEPNDSQEEAPFLSPGTYPNLVVCPNDKDWYRIRAARDTRIDVHIGFSHADGDLELYLMGSDGHPLVSSTSQTDDETVSYTTTTSFDGYIYVTGYRGASNTYTLTYAQRKVDDDFEPNDDLAHARLLQPGTYPHLILQAGDYDVFRINLPARSVVRVVTLFTHTLGDLDLYLINANGTRTLRSSTSTTDNEMVVYATEQPTWVYAFIKGATPHTSNTYTLIVQVEQQGACREDAFAPNQSPDQAPDLTPGVYNLTLCPHTTDWFRMTTGAEGVLGVRVDYEAMLGDLDVRLWNASANTVLAQSTNVTNTEQISYTVLTTTTFLAQVYGHDDLVLGNPYTLTYLFATFTPTPSPTPTPTWTPTPTFTPTSTSTPTPTVTPTPSPSPTPTFTPTPVPPRRMFVPFVLCGHVS